jgi:hypothetical protein
MSVEPRQPPGTKGIIYIECQYHANMPAEFLVSFGGATDGAGAFYLGRATGFDPLTTLLRKLGLSSRVVRTALRAHGRTAPSDTGRDPDPGYDPRTRLIAACPSSRSLGSYDSFDNGPRAFPKSRCPPGGLARSQHGCGDSHIPPPGIEAAPGWRVINRSLAKLTGRLPVVYERSKP